MADYGLKDFKLETTFQKRPECIIHESYEFDHSQVHQNLEIVKRWHPVRKLGEGAFGLVRLEERICSTARTKQDLRAVKILPKAELKPGRRGRIDHGKELLALTEFSRQKYKSCRVFVDFLGWFENEESIFLAMEYFPLGTLDIYIQKALEENETKVIARQLAVGLMVMHKEGFAHRDLKPENIFIVQNEPNWWVKIGDFGISKRILNSDTVLHTIAGTPSYLAPEIYGYVNEGDEEESTYTQACDIWSFGCVVYQMFATRVPFPTPWDLNLFTKNGEFPDKPLVKRASDEGIAFIKSALVSLPSLRPTAESMLSSPWFQHPDGDFNDSEKDLVKGTEVLPVESELEQDQVSMPKITAVTEDALEVAELYHDEGIKEGLKPSKDILDSNGSGQQINFMKASNDNVSTASTPIARARDDVLAPETSSEKVPHLNLEVTSYTTDQHSLRYLYLEVEQTKGQSFRTTARRLAQLDNPGKHRMFEVKWNETVSLGKVRQSGRQALRFAVYGEFSSSGSKSLIGDGNWKLSLNDRPIPTITSFGRKTSISGEEQTVEIRDYRREVVKERQENWLSFVPVFYLADARSEGDESSV